jgi:hypothetical protein
MLDYIEYESPLARLTKLAPQLYKPHSLQTAQKPVHIFQGVIRCRDQDPSPTRSRSENQISELGLSKSQLVSGGAC